MEGKEIAIGVVIVVWLLINLGAVVYAIRDYFRTWKRD